MEEKVTIVTKRKQIQIIFDYSLDQRIPFNVNPRGISPDEFEIDLTISGIKQAVALGMFAKEHKFEVSGLGEMNKPKASSTSVKKAEPKEQHPESVSEETASASLLNL